MLNISVRTVAGLGSGKWLNNNNNTNTNNNDSLRIISSSSSFIMHTKYMQTHKDNMKKYTIKWQILKHTIKYRSKNVVENL